MMHNTSEAVKRAGEGCLAGATLNSEQSLIMQTSVGVVMEEELVEPGGALRVQRSFTNVLSGDVQKSSAFYENLLGMTRHFESDWFVILTHKDIDGLEYGILQRDHAIVPPDVQATPAGVIITFVVADCDEVYHKAVAAGASVIEEPTDMPYGQRRMLLHDPDGTVVDVSAPTALVV